MKKQDSNPRDSRAEAARVALVQRLQLDELESQQSAIRQQTEKLIGDSRDQSRALDEIESSMADLWREIGGERPAQADLEGVKPLESLELDEADHAEIDAASRATSTSVRPSCATRATGRHTFVTSRRMHDPTALTSHTIRFSGCYPTASEVISLRGSRPTSRESATATGWDYAIAACCGALAGLIDAFLVGVPGDSLLGGLSDKAAGQLVQRFATVLGWKGPKGKADPTRSAIGFLERKFGREAGVNYDHRYSRDVGGLFSMSTKNHHIKSLAHSPSPVGLLFSVLDQFTGHASFVADGRLIRIRSDSTLEGSDIPTKLFAAFVNWIGHILSDLAGASGSKARGSGVPIPFFELLQLANFGSFGEDRQTLAELAVKIFEEGYDARFGAALAVPVLINELSIRTLWAVKRRYCHGYTWSDCKPSATQPSLRRMLLVGSGCLVTVDLADAALRERGQPAAMLIHLNLVAWVRFAFLGLREIHAFATRNAERMRRIDEAIHADLTALLADSAPDSRGRTS